MAILKFTFATPGDSETTITTDDAVMLMTPGGRKVASSLSEGDTVCLCPDGTHPVTISSIEEV